MVVPVNILAQVIALLVSIDQIGLRCLHDRAGTLTSLLYKDEMVSVCLSVTQLTQSSQHAQL